MSKSLIELVVTVTVDHSPEEFLEEFDTLELEAIMLHLRSRNSKTITPKVLDFDVINIDEI